MCKMRWGDHVYETREVITQLLGRRDHTVDELIALFRTGYGRYHCPTVVDHPAVRQRTADDVTRYIRTQELPDYMLSEAPVTAAIE